MRVAIIGAGLTGLTAGRALHTAGLAPVIYDKGRGVGGRLSTRRAEGGLQFDHGAQYLPAKSDAFRTFLSEIEVAGAVGRWTLDDGSEKAVGAPGMTAIGKHLATGLDVRLGVEVPSIRRTNGGWAVAGETFDRVICTAPAPQTAKIIGPDHPLCKTLDAVVMEPNLTLMLALPEGSLRPFTTRRDPEDDIAWIALDSAKQGRKGPACWVAQAGLAWSRAHLELDKDEIAAKMLPLVCDRIGAEPHEALYVAAHRWRYAQASTPLGQPFVTDADSLFLGGDWAISARAEGAWTSGTAMATAVLETR